MAWWETWWVVALAGGVVGEQSFCPLGGCQAALSFAMRHRPATLLSQPTLRSPCSLTSFPQNGLAASSLDVLWHRGQGLGIPGRWSGSELVMSPASAEDARPGGGQGDVGFSPSVTPRPQGRARRAAESPETHAGTGLTPKGCPHQLWPAVSMVFSACRSRAVVVCKCHHPHLLCFTVSFSVSCKLQTLAGGYQCWDSHLAKAQWGQCWDSHLPEAQASACSLMLCVRPAGVSPSRALVLSLGL